MNFQLDELEKQILFATEGEPISQYILGSRLITGYIFEQDIMGGFYWYTQSIMSGYIHAKWNAGAMLVEGEIKFKNAQNCGFKLIESAAKEGLWDACEFLANSYKYGKYDLNKDEEKYKLWKEKCSYEIIPFNFGEKFNIEKMLNIKINKPILKYKSSPF